MVYISVHELRSYFTSIVSICVYAYDLIVTVLSVFVFKLMIKL